MNDQELSGSTAVVGSMTLKVQFAKCVLCVALYLIVRACWLCATNRTGGVRAVEKANGTREAGSRSKLIDLLPSQIKDIASQSESALAGDPGSDDTGRGMLYPQIARICRKYNLETAPTRNHFLYDARHGSLYCWIRKVASNTFTKLFSDMRNRHVARDYYKEANVLAPQSLKELMTLTTQSKVLRLLVVRHPFERIVSAYRTQYAQFLVEKCVVERFCSKSSGIRSHMMTVYPHFRRDRIEDNTKYTDQAWMYARKIFRVTRPGIFRSNASTSSLQRIFTRDKRLRIVPTFNEFAEWLVQTPPSDDDVHWVSYYKHCAVCNVSYNIVLKIDEYALDEIGPILPKIGIDRPTALLPRLQASRGGPTDYETTCRYIGTLKLDTVAGLHERYRIDFEMYNYSLSKYVECVGRSE